MITLVTNIKKNWQSGLTIALVSIPLSISLAVASQTTPVAGIITAIWAGLVASLFGGSNFNIIGPTGALSGILASYALIHGAQSLALLAIITGIFIMIAYFMHLERYLVFIPAGTIHGFTLGVACIIALNQLNFALGLKGLPVHEHFLDNVVESFAHITALSAPTLILFLLFLALLFACTRFIPRIPGVILATPLGIAVGYAVSHHYLPFTVETLGQRFGSISFMLFQSPTWYFDKALISTGLILALIAILETMISARIADGMTKTKHSTRKELLGLSLANIASGIMGGIPATAALARTALNVKSHATHRMSATICSIAITLISLLFLSYFSFIPLAIIAAILVYTAFRMVEAEHLIKLFRFDKTSFAIALLVAGITLYQDPIIGILVGIAIMLIIFMEQISHGYFEIHTPAGKTKEGAGISSEKSPSTTTLIYSFKGQLAYINGQAHIARFETGFKQYTHFILNLAVVYFIDIDGVDALTEIVEYLHTNHKKVVICGVSPTIYPLVTSSKTLKELEKKGLFFESSSQALEYLQHTEK